MSDQHSHLPSRDEGKDGEKVYEAEVIHEEYRSGSSSGERREGATFRSTAWNWTSMRGGMGGMGGFDVASRYAPAVTLFLLFVVLFRFGFLAGLGFLFFYAVGAAFSTVQLVRRMAEGKSVNPWPWRVGNWALSFLLAGWLSGGFR